MPQFDPSTYSSQLLWLLITFGVLFLIVWKVALPRISDVRDARQRRVEDDLKKAEALRAEAEGLFAALEKSRANATSEAQGIHRAAAQAISEERARRLTEAAQRIAAETGAAERRIAEEKNRAAETIPDVAGEVVRAAVERLIGASVGQSEARGAIEAARSGAR